MERRNAIYYAATSLFAFNSSMLGWLSSCTPEEGPAEGGLSITFSFSSGVRVAEGSMSGVETQIWGVVILSAQPTDSIFGASDGVTFCSVLDLPCVGFWFVGWAVTTGEVCVFWGSVCHGKLICVPNSEVVGGCCFPVTGFSS